MMPSTHRWREMHQPSSSCKPTLDCIGVTQFSGTTGLLTRQLGEHAEPVFRESGVHRFSTGPIKPEFFECRVNLFKCLLTEVADGQQPSRCRIQEITHGKNTGLFQTVSRSNRQTHLSDAQVKSLATQTGVFLSTNKWNSGHSFNSFLKKISRLETLLVNREASGFVRPAPSVPSVWQKAYGIRTQAETLETRAKPVFLRTKMLAKQSIPRARTTFPRRILRPKTVMQRTMPALKPATKATRTKDIHTFRDLFPMPNRLSPRKFPSASPALSLRILRALFNQHSRHSRAGRSPDPISRPDPPTSGSQLQSPRAIITPGNNHRNLGNDHRRPPPRTIRTAIRLTASHD